jgi:hypothetical protein
VFFEKFSFLSRQIENSFESQNAPHKPQLQTNNAGDDVVRVGLIGEDVRITFFIQE